MYGEQGITKSAKVDGKQSLLQGYIDRMRKANVDFSDALNKIGGIANDLNLDPPQDSKSNGIANSRKANEGKLYSLEILIEEYESGITFLQSQLFKLESLL